MADRTLVEKARLRAGLTLTELAARAQTSRSVVRDLEARRSSPQAATLKRICDELELDPVEVMDDLDAHFAAEAT